MGFDNECIQNIQSLAGEYFCPVCRLLVYPDEALYTQCTHLYCKPCLSYVVSTTRTCPYDGYPVAEADTKPLKEVNKALAETIGRIAVNCLYHRSGCTWQGALSETTAHCAGCAFGNSPVVCNRCGTQIVHRQVQEHAQICPGEQPLAQQGENPPPAASEQNQSTTQSGMPALQSQPAEISVTTVAGQSQNQGAPNAQPAPIAQVAPTPDQQWYQQQQQYYQQYYQQYPGYDPYQQQYQQYMQYHLHLQANPGQPPPQSFVQPQSQPQPQTQVQLHGQTQPQPQPQPQVSSQPQVPSQPQPHVLSQPQPQAQIQSQTHHHLQSQMTAQSHIQAQIPQLPHAPVQPHSQIHLQGHAPAMPQQQVGHAHPHGQSHLNLQMPQNPQLHPQMQHLQSHPLAQSQPRPQQTQPQSYHQHHVQHHPPMQPQPQPVQSQPQPPFQPQPHPHLQPQQQHSAVHAVTGHQSYPQPQPYQQVSSAAPQQHGHMHAQQQSAPHQMVQPPVQLQGAFPTQQQTQMHPSQQPLQSHVPPQLPQQPVMTPSPGQHPQQLPQQQVAHHPDHQIPHQPALQLSHHQPTPHQQPQFPQHQTHAHVHQPQPHPGQAEVPVQQSQQNSFARPLQIQPHQSLRPQGSLPLPHQAHSQPLLQQSVPSAQGLAAAHQASKPAVRPMGHSQAVMQQTTNQFPVVSTGSVLAQDINAASKKVPYSTGQPSADQGIIPWMTNHQPLASDQHPLMPHSDVQSSLMSLPSGKNVQASASHTSIKPISSEMNRVDSLSGIAGEAPKLDVDGTCNEVASSAELKVEKSIDLKVSESEEKVVGASDDKQPHSDSVVNEMENSSLKHENVIDSLEKDGNSDEMVTKKMVEEGTNDELDHTEAANKVEDSLHARKEDQDGPLQRGFSSLPGGNVEGQDVRKQKDPLETQFSHAWPNGRGMQSQSGAEGSQGQTLDPLLKRSTNMFPQNPLNVNSGYDGTATYPDHHDRNSSLFPRPGFIHNERGLLSPGQAAAKGFIQPHHSAPAADDGRYRQLPMPLGPSYLQDQLPQRPPAADGMSTPRIHHHGPNQERNFHEHLGPQVQMHGPSVFNVRPPGHTASETFPQYQKRQPAIGEEHFNTPMEKQSFGSIPHSDVLAGSIPVRGAAFGKEPQPSGPLGPRQSPMPPYPVNQRKAEPLSGATLPASDLAGSMMPRGPGLEGEMSRLHPINCIQAETFGSKQPGFFEGKDAIGGIHLPGDRFKHFAEERYRIGLQDGFRRHEDECFKSFPLISAHHMNDRKEFEEDLKQFPRPAHLDGENKLRPAEWRPNIFGDQPPHGPSHDVSKSVAPPDSSWHKKDTLPPSRSPFGERMPANQFGSRPAAHGLGGQARLQDFDGRDPRGFDDRWSGTLPSSLHGEHDAPGNFQINDPVGTDRSAHQRSGDMLPIHVHGSEKLLPGSLLNHLPGGDLRNLPGNMHVGERLGPAQMKIGEPATFGGVPGHLRVGGPGNLPHLHTGDPAVEGNFHSHMRTGGEPGYGGGFPSLGFQDTLGNVEPFDHLRLRKPGSMGWCRICKVDCESVEGLEVHSQTKEHQKMAMEIVLSIKQGNAKKQKLSSKEHPPWEDSNKQWRGNFEIRGTKN